MSTILDIVETKKGTIISCALTDANFMDAESVDILSDGARFTLNDFKIAETRSCFTVTPPPYIKLNESVPEKFLQRGKKVIFNIKGKAYA